jgi:aspartate/glutamate racemase
VKTIGIVGGIAWPSSLVYYRIINELVAQRLGDGGLHSASLLLTQTDFEQIERNQREGRWNLVGDLLAEQGHVRGAWPRSERAAGLSTRRQDETRVCRPQRVQRFR